MFAHRAVALVLVAAASVSRIGAAQQPTGPATVAVARGSVSGVLTVADTAQPARNATVRLVTIDRRTALTATSDGDGRFEITDVSPGQYTLTAAKPGLLDMVYGARKAGADNPGVTITVAAGQRVEKIALALPRGSVITGVVTDEYGEPAFNVPVRAMRYVYRDGYASLIGASATAVSDDRGMYRVAGLMPGEYLVSAIPRNTVQTQADAAESMRQRFGPPAEGVRLPVVPTRGYVPVHYPSATNGQTASAVTVRASTEVAGIDLRLQAIQTATISGRITSADGSIPQSRLQLVDRSLPMNTVGIWFKDMRPDGSFTFNGVVPGTYLLKAFGTPGGQAGVAGGSMWGELQVSVAESGVAGLELRMQHGIRVTGQLRLDGLPAVDRSRLRVSLLPIASPTDWEMASVNVTPDDTGAFSATNVLPGLYRVQVTGVAAGWTIDTAVVDGKDAADLHLAIDGTRDVAGLEVKLTARRAAVTGSVSSSSGAPVADYTLLLFPEDNRLWLPQSRRILLSQPGADGQFAFPLLPAGNYRLAALADAEPGRHTNPAFLAELFSTAIAVTVADGEQRRQDVRVR